MQREALSVLLAGINPRKEKSKPSFSLLTKMLPCILKEQRERTAAQRGTSMTQELTGLLLAGSAEFPSGRLGRSVNDEAKLTHFFCFSSPRIEVCIRYLIFYFIKKSS